MMIFLILGRFKPIESRPLPVLLAFSAVMLALRVLLALPFWNSGLTRWVDLPGGFLTKLSSSTTYLFANEFQLHFFWGAVPIPFPGLVGYLTATAEIILPILLVIGLLSRLGALALLAMSIVIQLVFPDGFINVVDPMNSHALWMAYAIAIVICGPGIFSADWVARKFGIERSGQTVSA